MLEKELYQLYNLYPELFSGITKLCINKRVTEEMATHSSILAWEIPWTDEPCTLKESDTT